MLLCTKSVWELGAQVNGAWGLGAVISRSPKARAEMVLRAIRALGND
jgi:hypothetical protein